jgi:hypothetical protein
MNRPAALLAALLLGSAGLAQAGPADQACGAGGCGAGRIDPAVIRAAVRAEDGNASAGRTGERAAARPQASIAPNARDAASTWERRLGGPGAHEDYNCLLSFGLGGTLNGDGFLAGRLLGRTRVLRGE